MNQKLLQFDFRTGSFQFLFDGFRVILRSSLFYRFWSSFDQCLRFGQTQSGDFSYDLNYTDLGRTCFCQNDVKLSLSCVTEIATLYNLFPNLNLFFRNIRNKIILVFSKKIAKTLIVFHKSVMLINSFYN